MGVMVGAIVGRDAELAAIDRMLDGLHEGPGSLLLAGNAGIGKTRIWGGGVAAASARGFRVLAARPGGGEVRLAFATLGDLLEGLSEDVLDDLPAPQRRALRVALLLEEARATALDARLVGVALIGALRELARRSPVLVAIDDVQWLDVPSATALAFAARRLRAEPIGFLLTLRSGEVTSDLEAALPETVSRLTVGPLSLGAIQSVLRDQLGTVFPRPTLRRLWEISAGNPFYALELCRALLERGGRFPEGGTVPIPVSLGELLHERVRAVPPTAREVLLAAALASAPSLELVRAVLGADAWEHLQPALEARLVELEDSRLCFTHPLLATAVTARADPARRRALHRRLARAVTDPEEQARHLAHASQGPDEEVATALETSAESAVARGAPDAAAELLELAVRLTPADKGEARTRRILVLARNHSVAGDVGRAETILGGMLVELPAGRSRAQVLLELLRIDTDARNTVLAEQALEEAGDDPGLRSAILLELSQRLEIAEGPPAALGPAREGLVLAERSGQRSLELLALSLVGHLETLVGDPNAQGLLERARVMELEGFAVQPWHSPGHWIAVSLMWADELGRARPLLEAEYKKALELGDDFSRTALLFHLAQLETRAGDATRARAYAQEGWELSEAGGREQSDAVNLHALALAEAHFGDAEQAEAHAHAALTVFERQADRFFTIHTRSVLAFLALARGDYEAASRALAGMHDLRAEIGVGEPGIFTFDADEIEALIGLGRIDEAETLIEALEVRGRKLDRPRLRATAARCRGLALAARSRLEEALLALEEALREHERLPVPLERGRTLLALGGVHRRALQKRQARQALEEARALFAELESGIWVERASAELARIGGRSSSGSELTPTEQRVAARAAAGRTNKEISAELCVSVNTVQTTLRHVYAKLGVRSRTELAAKSLSDSKLH